MYLNLHYHFECIQTHKPKHVHFKCILWNSSAKTYAPDHESIVSFLIRVLHNNLYEIRTERRTSTHRNAHLWSVWLPIWCIICITYTLFLVVMYIWNLARTNYSIHADQFVWLNCVIFPFPFPFHFNWVRIIDLMSSQLLHW